EEHTALLGEIGNGNTDVAENGPEEDAYPLPSHQLIRHGDRIGWRAPVIAADDLQRPSKNAAGLVYLLQGQGPAIAIGQREGRKAGVAIKFADPDRLLRFGTSCHRRREKRRRESKPLPPSLPHHPACSPMRFGGSPPGRASRAQKLRRLPLIVKKEG